MTQCCVLVRKDKRGLKQCRKDYRDADIFCVSLGFIPHLWGRKARQIIALGQIPLLAIYWIRHGAQCARRIDLHWGCAVAS